DQIDRVLSLPANTRASSLMAQLLAPLCFLFYFCISASTSQEHFNARLKRSLELHQPPDNISNLTTIAPNNLKDPSVLTDDGDVYTRDEKERTPLHIAAINGDLTAAKVLIEKDPRLINTTDINHWYPIHQAASNGKCDIISLLIDNGADVDAKGRYSNNDLSVPPSTTALHWAARKGHIECARTLLMKGANINHQDYTGYTALHSALNYGENEVAKFLVENGANTSLETMYRFLPLDLASQGPWSTNEIVRYFASHSKNPVHRAVLVDKMNTLYALINANIEINTTDEDQYTPLHIAAKTGNF
ncbi:hypothetical protein FO519_010134, partial [Halicephalobus sp. NKZ332]